MVNRSNEATSNEPDDICHSFIYFLLSYHHFSPFTIFLFFFFFFFFFLVLITQSKIGLIFSV